MKQPDFFDFKELDWQDHYDGMPECNNINEPPPAVVTKFKFRTQEDFCQFMEVVKPALFKGERVFDGSQKKNDYQAWFPLKEKGSKFEIVDGDDEK